MRIIGGRGKMQTRQKFKYKTGFIDNWAKWQPIRRTGFKEHKQLVTEYGSQRSIHTLRPRLGSLKTSPWLLLGSQGPYARS